eukprot:jgi/Chrzof1/12536/Cz06g37220.t1
MPMCRPPTKTFDYCQTPTQKGCFCSNSWAFNGSTYAGTCRTGLVPGRTNPTIDVDTNWCYVDPSTCSWPYHIDGYAFDKCTPESGRVTVNGAQCHFPATYGGVQLYDCITYKQSTAAAVQPWCFTNTGTGAWDFCAPPACSHGLKHYCPATAPSSQSDFGAWSTDDCLEAVCLSRQPLVNISACVNDTAADKAMMKDRYSLLAGSDTFNQMLSSNNQSASLDAYCNSNFGYLCLDNLVAPKCPAVWRDNNNWYVTSKAQKLCDLGCLRQLCSLQELNSQLSNNITCADNEVTSLVKWTLMDMMDAGCSWGLPAHLLCAKLQSPPQLCADNSDLSSLTGTITDGAPTNGNYNANSDCTWNLDMPDQPYLQVTFNKLDTEALYDTVTVEDLDGLLGMFSGSQLQTTPLTTDTGYIRVNFSSDMSIQGSGFALTYSSSATPDVNLPTCLGGAQLIRVLVRTRAYSAENSWVLTKKSSAALQQQTVVMAGGNVPSSQHITIPNAIAALGISEYKDYRSFYSYDCLPQGDYTLTLFDAFGDGWGQASLTLSQMSADGSSYCTLASGTVEKANKTFPVTIKAGAATDTNLCISAISGSSVTYYVQAALLIKNTNGDNSLSAGRRSMLMKAIANLLNVDKTMISMTKPVNATSNDVISQRRRNLLSADAATATTAEPSVVVIKPKASNGFVQQAGCQTADEADEAQVEWEADKQIDLMQLLPFAQRLSAAVAGGIFDVDPDDVAVEVSVDSAALTESWDASHTSESNNIQKVEAPQLDETTSSSQTQRHLLLQVMDGSGDWVSTDTKQGADLLQQTALAHGSSSDVISDNMTSSLNVSHHVGPAGNGSSHPITMSGPKRMLLLKTLDGNGEWVTVDNTQRGSICSAPSPGGRHW